MTYLLKTNIKNCLGNKDQFKAICKWKIVFFDSIMVGILIKEPTMRKSWKNVKETMGTNKKRYTASNIFLYIPCR